MESAPTTYSRVCGILIYDIIIFYESEMYIKCIFNFNILIDIPIWLRTYGALYLQYTNIVCNWKYISLNKYLYTTEMICNFADSLTMWQVHQAQKEHVKSYLMKVVVGEVWGAKSNRWLWLAGGDARSWLARGDGTAPPPLSDVTGMLIIILSLILRV